MSFPPDIKEDALLRSKRHCCLCEEFAGRSTNVHHIQPEGEGGANTIDNAIVLCLRCHAEAGHYNSAHPIGNKYSPSEIRRRRDQWWEWCRNNPATMPPKSPVTITPERVTLASEDWKSKSKVKVVNRSDRVVYQVWVKITIHSATLTWKDIQFEQIVRKSEINAKIGPMEISAEGIAFAGTDADRRQSKMVRIYSLDPFETLTCLLTDVSRDEPRHRSKHEVTLTICDFSEDPPAVQEKENAAAQLVRMPEVFTVEAMGFFVKRIDSHAG